MSKRIILDLVLAAGSTFATAPQADAAIFVRRIAPVRRVAARAILPPYGVVRRPVVGPVIGYPMTYGAPVLYSPGVMVGFGF